jgi:hypothetical protein
MIPDEVCDLPLICSLHMTHGFGVIKIINLSLDEIKEPRLEWHGIFDYDCISTVLGATCS